MTSKPTTEPAVAERPGNYALVNGIRLYYEDYGSGRPLVLLPGGMLTIELNFDPLIAELASGHRVLAVELQGHGRTEDIEREMTIDNLVDDVVALLRSLGILEADFLGFSLGGMVALGLALYHPHLVGALVIASTPYEADGFHPETRPESADPASPRLPTAADFAALQTAYREVAPDPEAFSTVQAKVAALVGSYEGWTSDEIRALQARTLILVGDNDFVRLDHAAEMARLVGHAELRVIAHTTHMEMTRRPQEVLEEVLAFLAPAGSTQG
jgi:pimeloyl-ACP methyl ester carboxylesterase